MKQIKASEIKPGMTIRWGRWDISYQCTLTRVERFNGGPGVQEETRQGKTVFLRGDEDVLVVKEPPQPEEPTEFGARVVVKGRRFLRSPEDKCDVQAWLEEGDGIWRDWDELCAMGPVTVIPDRIEIGEWPVDDDGLKAYRWRDRFGFIWHSERRALDFPDLWVTSLRGPTGRVETTKPTRGPWTRVTDA